MTCHSQGGDLEQKKPTAVQLGDLEEQTPPLQQTSMTGSNGTDKGRGNASPCTVRMSSHQHANAVEGHGHHVVTCDADTQTSGHMEAIVHTASQTCCHMPTDRHYVVLDNPVMATELATAVALQVITQPICCLLLEHDATMFSPVVTASWDLIRLGRTVFLSWYSLTRQTHNIVVTPSADAMMNIARLQHYVHTLRRLFALWRSSIASSPSACSSSIDCPDHAKVVSLYRRCTRAMSFGLELVVPMEHSANYNSWAQEQIAGWLADRDEVGTRIGRWCTWFASHKKCTHKLHRLVFLWSGLC